MIKTIILNGRSVEYRLERKRVKNINLRIKPDLSISVSANSSVSLNVIENFIRSKADYILKALDHFAAVSENMQKPLEYIDGETICVFGLDMSLRVVTADSNGASCDGQYVILKVTDASSFELKQKTLEDWRRLICEECVRIICERFYPLFREYGIAFPELRFRRMKSRWGSCQPTRGVITFSTRLAEMPVPAVEYVVMHEFVHFIHPNHSKLFYEQVSLFMPDWKDRKRMLDGR